MAKVNLDKVFKELDKCEENDILVAFQSIKEFLTNKLISIQKDAEERANELQNKVDSLK